jgi:serine/alanine adding enzyme
MIKEVVYTTEDASEWSSVLPDEESAFGSVEFARVVEQHLGYRARLYVLQDDTSLIAYPFLMRPIRSSLLSEEICGRVSDTVSPDFTGPLARGTPTRALVVEFQKRLSAFLSSQNVVTEFIRLHPWKAFTGALRWQCLQVDREIVYIDLTWPEERLWRASFNGACRKNINRSRRENVRIFAARTMGDIREFYRVYVDTMKQRNALGHYFFSLDYFAAIFDQLRGSARFVLAEYRNQVVAGTLYLHDRDDVYSYLGGADSNFQQVRPTNAIIYDTILWGQREGKKRLILGGGYSPNDGILRFKASFSPQRSNFLVYRCVHLSEKYDALCRSWSSIYGRAAQTAAYFPRYRLLPSSEAQDSCYAARAAAPEPVETDCTNQIGGS